MHPGPGPPLRVRHRRAELVPPSRRRRAAPASTSCPAPARTRDPGSARGQHERRQSRKVSKRELLRRREDSWAPKLRSASLVAEVDLRPGHTDQVASVLGRLYAELPDPRTQGPAFLLPVARLPGRGHGRRGGHQLSRRNLLAALWEAAEYQRQRAGSEHLGGRLQPGGRPPGDGDVPRPAAALRRADPDARRPARATAWAATSGCCWPAAGSTPGSTPRASWPGRRRRDGICGWWSCTCPPGGSSPSGGDYALDVVDRCLDLLDRLSETDPDLDGVRLPGPHRRGRPDRSRGAGPRPAGGGARRDRDAPIGPAPADRPRPLRDGRPGDPARRRRDARRGRDLAGDRRRRSGHGAQPRAVGRVRRGRPADRPPADPAGALRPGRARPAGIT